MGGESERRVPVVGVVAVCFLIGFAGIGAYRWASAQPVPAPPMAGAADESPFKSLPAPTLPPPSMHVVAPVGSIDPPELPKPAARELLPPPTMLPVETTPVPPLPAPAETVVPLPKPAAIDSPVPLPAPAPLPAPVATEVPKLPPPAEVIPPPRAVEPPALPVVPQPSPPVPVEVKPIFNLRPDTPPLTLSPKEIPPPRSDLPPPRMAVPDSVPAPRPVIDATTTSISRTPGTLAPGDAPMKHLFLSAVIGAAVAGTAPTEAFAQDPAKPGEKEVTLKDLDKKVKELSEELAGVKKKKDDLEKLVNGSADGKALTPTEKGLVRRVEELETTVTALKGKIETLEKTGAKSVSEKAPLPTVLAGKGKVVLVNEFRTKLSIIVNKTSHPLDPNEMKEVLVPEGELNYELVEFPNAAPVKSTIKEGETVTLRIK